MPPRGALLPGDISPADHAALIEFYASSAASIPSYAPGCFGSSTCYAPASGPCMACPFAGQCGPAAGHTAALVTEMFAAAGTSTRTERKATAEAASRVKSDAKAGIVRRAKLDLSSLTAEEKAEHRRRQQRASALRRRIAGIIT